MSIEYEKFFIFLTFSFFVAIINIVFILEADFMNSSEIREPMQKRSIEKKEKIIKSGFELICEKGYYNTNTAEIAKNAGVSTGIIYQYFKDKHDIFIEALKKYAENIFYPMLNISVEAFDKNNLNEIFEKMIDSFIQNHKLSQSAHEEIMAMVHSDKTVAFYFRKQEMEMTIKIYDLLVKSGFTDNNLMEKSHIAIGMIDNLCHEIVYHKHTELNYDIMTNICINTIINMLNKED